MKKINRISTVLFYAVTSLSPWMVTAQEIPRQLLRENLEFCKLGCGQNNSELICQILCDCTVRQFDQNLSLDRYLRVTEAMESGDMLDEDREFLNETAKFCTAKLDAILPPGKGKPPDML